MRYRSPQPDPVEGFTPLAALLSRVSPEDLLTSRIKVSELTRERLLALHNYALVRDNRVVFFLASQELTRRAIPPCFRHPKLDWKEASLNLKFDLLIADLDWLRRWYPKHSRLVRYRRCKTLLTGTERQLLKEAEYSFWNGRRPAWKLVGSLSVTEQQQWDCAWLRSTPINQRAASIQQLSSKVLGLLSSHLEKVRDTKLFGKREKNAALLRRHQLWICSRMTKDGSPTAIAKRITQLTGETVSRQVVAKQLAKIRQVLGSTLLKS